MRAVQSSTREDALAVAELLKTFPYCQVLQVVSAKTARDHALPGAAGQLQRAAVYSTDRKLLKAWMDNTRGGHISTESTAGGEQLREALAHDLQRLKRLKSDFEQSLQKFEAAKNRKNTSARENPFRTKETDTHEKPKKNKNKNKNKNKKKAVASSRKAQKKKDGRDEPDGGHLLHQIQDFRPKSRGVYSAKTKKQLAIIDRFIKRQPSIARKAQPVKPGHDLSQKSGVLTEDVISSTLVDLLIRQGKKEKAIEALKKLIWKFPRKKAIFAARIEELKK